MFILHHHGLQQVEFDIRRYVDDNQLYVALVQMDGDLYADLSVCIPGVPLAEGEFIFKTYSGNEGLLQAMMSTGKIEIVRTINPPLGFLPVCRLRN
ncbi:hypothetical protein SH528x_003865 [Novipirellula sp. SH528]|uniref:hypothetical protein n=1 Tax=Novipirellula sp. SH528 TaxID=3454466 RepID=UPI003F9FC4B5